jgi:hypothetical protein
MCKPRGEIPWEEPDENLLDLTKGTNLFTQE